MSRLAALLLLLGTAGAQAAVISPRPDKVALSIYHEGIVDTAALAQDGQGRARDEGLALVSESRSLDLPAGPVDIQFRGVAGTMVPQTAQVTGLPDAIRESNFDFDLLSPGALIAKSAGQAVELVRTDPQTGQETRQTATLVSGPDGVVLKIGDHYEALGCSGAPERLVFAQLPDRLLDSPTLTVHAVLPRAGHYNVTLRYIATGLNWSADYVAHIHADDRTLDLSGWITLANFSGSGFSNVPVDVIAGHVATTGDDRPPAADAVTRNDQCWPTDIDWATYRSGNLVAGSNVLAATPPPMALMARAADAETVTVTGTSIAARNLGDYKLYPLREPTDVAARQTKQVQFLDNHAVAFTRVYRAAAASDPQSLRRDAALPAAIVLRLENSTGGGLGKPLPAGGVSAMSAAGGTPMLIGRDRIDDVAVGLPLEIKAGSTMAVRAQAGAVESSILGAGRNRIRRTTIEVTAINDKNGAIAFEWRQTTNNGGMKLVSQSRPHDTQGGDLLWRVPLKPGERAVFRYTMDRPA